MHGALRMSVKILLMWNSKLLIDSGGDEIVATSLLEASNLLVLKVFVNPISACCHAFPKLCDLLSMIVSSDFRGWYLVSGIIHYTL